MCALPKNGAGDAAACKRRVKMVRGGGCGGPVSGGGAGLSPLRSAPIPATRGRSAASSRGLCA